MKDFFNQKAYIIINNDNEFRAIRKYFKSLGYYFEAEHLNVEPTIYKSETNNVYKPCHPYSIALS